MATKQQIDKKLDYWNTHQPKTKAGFRKRTAQFKRLAKTNFKPVHTIKSGQLKGCVKGYLGSRRYLKSKNNNYILGWS